MKRYQAAKPNRFLPPQEPCNVVAIRHPYTPGLRYALRKLGPRWSPLVSTYNPPKIV